jgi:hypothetical protein
MSDKYSGKAIKTNLRCVNAGPWSSPVRRYQGIILARDVIMLWGELGLAWADLGRIAISLSKSKLAGAVENLTNLSCVTSDFSKAKTGSARNTG